MSISGLLLLFGSSLLPHWVLFGSSGSEDPKRRFRGGKEDPKRRQRGEITEFDGDFWPVLGIKGEVDPLYRIRGKAWNS